MFQHGMYFKLPKWGHDVIDNPHLSFTHVVFVPSSHDLLQSLHLQGITCFWAIEFLCDIFYHVHALLITKQFLFDIEKCIVKLGALKTTRFERQFYQKYCDAYIFLLTNIKIVDYVGTPIISLCNWGLLWKYR